MTPARLSEPGSLESATTSSSPSDSGDEPGSMASDTTSPSGTAAASEASRQSSSDPRRQDNDTSRGVELAVPRGEGDRTLSDAEVVYNCCADNLYDNPLGHEFVGGAILPLDNGLYAFLGTYLESSAGGLCMGCHSLGPSRVVQIQAPLLGFVRENPQLYRDDDAESVRRVYRDPVFVNDIVGHDQQRQIEALEQLGIASETAPLANALRRFAEPLNMAMAAVELGVAPEHLVDTELGEAIASSASGRVTRRRFEERYARAFQQLYGE